MAQRFFRCTHRLFRCTRPTQFFLSTFASPVTPPSLPPALPDLLHRLQRAPGPDEAPLAAVSELGSQWRELQACVAAFFRVVADGGDALPLFHARLHACFLALFDRSWLLAVSLHPSVLPGAVAGEGGGAPWASYAASPSAGLPPPLSPARQASTQLGALCAAALDLAMACGCVPDAAGGARLLAMAGLRNADAALAAFNALAGGRGEGGTLALSVHRVLLRACARHGGAPEVALPALWALSRGADGGVARCGGEVAALIAALRGAGGGGGDEHAPITRRLALGLLLEQAVGARATGGGGDGDGGDDDEIFATVGSLIGRGGGGGGGGEGTNFPDDGGEPPAAAAPAAAAPRAPRGSTSGSDADSEFSASSGCESPLSGGSSGSEDEGRGGRAAACSDDADEAALVAAFDLREVSPGVWLPAALLEGEESGEGGESEEEKDGSSSTGGEDSAFVAFAERSVRESNFWRAAAAQLAAARPGGGFSPAEFEHAMLQLKEMRESDAAAFSGQGGGAAAPPPWALSAAAHGSLWAPRVAARVEEAAACAALLLGAGGGAATAAAAADPRLAAAADLCRAHPALRSALLAGVRARVAAGAAAALQRAELSSTEFLLARRDAKSAPPPPGAPPAAAFVAWPIEVPPIFRQQVLLALTTAATAAVERGAAARRDPL
jgi:hypothetical protein